MDGIVGSIERNSRDEENDYCIVNVSITDDCDVATVT